MMTQLTTTRTDTAVTPRTASTIVPAGGLSRGGGLECCGGGCAGVWGGGAVVMTP